MASLGAPQGEVRSGDRQCVWSRSRADGPGREISFGRLRPGGRPRTGEASRTATGVGGPLPGRQGRAFAKDNFREHEGARSRGRGDFREEVLEARLVRLSDGAENPLCAYGSTQYWDAQDSWREVGINLLKGWGAVIAFPHEPLTSGAEYEAYLKVKVGSEPREYNWSFSVAPEGELRPLRLEKVEEIRIEEAR